MKRLEFCRKIDNVFGAIYKHVLITCSQGFQVLDRGSVASKMAMEMRKINKFGRSYQPGVSLDQDFKCLIIDSIISYGGD